ncbi:MAG: 2-dehydro-3-deoxygalactonokinase [Alphaproteobacteria bacterium]|nr:2-dehydro-3-deoxygalactonokinase [Alphaproteobacteria bacterium]
MTAWPADDGAWIGDAIAAGSVEEAVARAGFEPLLVYIDGAPQSGAVDLPVGPDWVLPACRSEQAGPGLRMMLPALVSADGAILRGAARPIGALRLMRGPLPGARPLLICDCRADGSVAWVHCADGELRRFSVSPIGAALLDALDRLRPAVAGARDEDDDVAFERGLSLAEDGEDLEGGLGRAMARVTAGETQGAAAGALLAGVLIGHDCARGLRLGKLGGPMALVGSGLPAERYSVALSRFGVAVRRIAPGRAMREGCRLYLHDAPPSA